MPLIDRRSASRPREVAVRAPGAAATAYSPSSPELAQRPARVRAACYSAGRRSAGTDDLATAYELLDGSRDSLTWIHIEHPTPGHVDSLAARFELHELLIEDIVTVHQRPKIDRYDRTLFVALRAARYADAAEQVRFDQLHVLVGDHWVVTLAYGSAPRAEAIRDRLERDPALLALGPEAVLYCVLDLVVDNYGPVIKGVGNDIDEIEFEVFGGDPAVSRRIYDLSGEVADFQRAVRPLQVVLSELRAGFAKYEVDEALRSYLRDVADHLTETSDSITAFRTSLRDILTVNASLVGQRQIEAVRELTEAGIEENEAMKKISAWAAIIFAPSLIGGIYGMNFDEMPELHWAYGYPFALSLMAGTTVILWAIFKRKRWI